MNVTETVMMCVCVVLTNSFSLVCGIFELFEKF